MAFQLVRRTRSVMLMCRGGLHIISIRATPAILTRDE
jgi:hypothetical protein